MAGATPDSKTAVWAYPIFLGIGLGFSLTLLVTAAQLSAPPDLIAITSGLLLAVRSLGGSIGIGICKWSNPFEWPGLINPRFCYLHFQAYIKPWERHCGSCTATRPFAQVSRGFHRSSCRK